MLSHIKAKLYTAPFITWGPSDIGDVFSVFGSSEVQMHSIFIYIFHIY